MPAKATAKPAASAAKPALKQAKGTVKQAKPPAKTTAKHAKTTAKHAKPPANTAAKPARPPANTTAKPTKTTANTAAKPTKTTANTAAKPTKTTANTAAKPARPPANTIAKPTKTTAKPGRATGALAETETALRAHALAKPEATEHFPWGERAIKVKGKVFLFMYADATKLSLSTKLPDSSGVALMLPFAKSTGYGLGKAGWVSASFERTDKPPIEMLCAWIDESYQAIAPAKLAAVARGTQRS
jgi:predicted DNA-binding protein (MmcQ/YjbR family)